MKWIAAFCLLFTVPAFTEENQAMQVKNPIVKIETTVGTFEVELFPKVAPKACENFLKLAEKNYYNGTIFHRIIPGFMIQGGDPLGTGTGGQSIWGKAFEDECKQDVKFDKPGYLAMANAGPRTNGSQFFVTTVATPHLHMKHTLFGQVTKGYDVVQKIEAVGTAGLGKPSQRIEIVKITQMP
ncbi:MAG: peptidylprolyl isomerase [Rhabdochlamydiaceae bacterium]